MFLLDFAKAFDLIDHTILLQKLTHINVPQMSTNWIRSFLADRKQRVRINECVSDWRTVNSGIPLGTVLGPVLFLVMINDLFTHLADRWKFVDDCTVAESISHPCNSNLQNIVNDINIWAIRNEMKLNVSKCIELIVDFPRNKQFFLPLDIGGVLVERVKSARVLGLMIPNSMKWDDHVNSIMKKAGKILLIIYNNSDNNKKCLFLGLSIDVLQHTSLFSARRFCFVDAT